MMLMMVIVQGTSRFLTCFVDTFPSWVVALTGPWLEDGRKSRKMRAMRLDWSMDSIQTKLRRLRRDAPESTSERSNSSRSSQIRASRMCWGAEAAGPSGRTWGERAKGVVDLLQ